MKAGRKSAKCQACAKAGVCPVCGMELLPGQHHDHGVQEENPSAQGEKKAVPGKNSTKRPGDGHSSAAQAGPSCGGEHSHDHSAACCCPDHGHHGHEHEHTHSHDGGIEKREIYLLAVGTVLFLLALLLPLSSGWKLALYLIAYLVIGGEVLLTAASNLVRGQVFDENFLMALATVGAFIIGEYPEGVMVMLLYQLGELLQTLAIRRSRKSIAQLMDIRPDYANVQRGGETAKVSPAEVAVGEHILIRPGEKVPLDGEVLEGTSLLDTRALTGESVPREVAPGSTVLSGCINGGGLLTVRVTKPSSESTVSKILELVENAGEKKAKSEKFITKFARVYTPVVVIVAVLLAFIPPLFVGGLSDWVYRALVFLVISCPCALVISVPLSFFAGIGGAGRQGILIKGSNFMDTLSRVDTVVFDKTGTLTRGVFEVQQICSPNLPDDELLRLAAHAEASSSHPIARAVVKRFGQPIDPDAIESVQEQAGYGVTAQIAGKTVLAGNQKLLAQNGIDVPVSEGRGSLLYLAVDGQYAGYIVVADEVKPDASEAIQLLRRCGVKKAVMLTGDRKEAAQEIADALAFDEVHAQLLPGDKVDAVESLLAQEDGGALAFAGDGINDAPVLTAADVGIAMGGLGSDAAIEAADVVIMDDQPSKIPQAIALSKRTLRIVRQNIVFALAMKLFFLTLGAFGMATLWEAVFADVGVTLIAVLNAMRALRAK